MPHAPVSTKDHLARLGRSTQTGTNPYPRYRGRNLLGQVGLSRHTSVLAHPARLPSDQSRTRRSSRLSDTLGPYDRRPAVATQTAFGEICSSPCGTEARRSSRLDFRLAVLDSLPAAATSRFCGAFAAPSPAPCGTHLESVPCST